MVGGGVVWGFRMESIVLPETFGMLNNNTAFSEVLKMQKTDYFSRLFYRHTVLTVRNTRVHKVFSTGQK